ncbi:hypothetical protein [Frankia sp. AgKG'84/4]|uniref:hypothetical protein n=1 Tax=Frankia sp. AgKG'84/4 TaxID=573490 RepID=UPI00200EDA16|nr:hypothetical protein [Frankia sp. AgKG'84/4]MCL9792978.1 hypothetical protein [Frankia sp. AgKG'84/4]
MSVESPSIQDPLPLDVDPHEIESFLRSNGWQRASYVHDVSAIWENVRLDASLMLPFDRTYRDFVPRLRDALGTISAVHHIEQDALPLRIVSSQNDIVLLRADQLTPYDSIPLGEAQILLAGISRMMLVAACSAIRPRPSNPGRRPSAATDFVANDLRLGHTLRGSFVLPIFVHHEDPDPATLDQAQAPWLTETQKAVSGPVAFSRQVVETLATGLDATRELLDPSGNISLDEAVERGTSAEMVESIGAMGQQEGVRSLDLSFVFSHSIPANPEIPSRIVVPRPEAEQVEKTVQSLRRRPIVARNEVIGQVIRLERAKDEEGGFAVIDGVVGQTRRRVKMALSGDAYQLAIRAHEQKVSIIAVGEFSLIRRSWHLTGDTEVRLLA